MAVSKGAPTKTSNKQRHVRRMRTIAKQPERKLRHILKRNTLREAFEYANKYSHLAILRQLRPEYQQELAAEGQL